MTAMHKSIQIRCFCFLCFCLLFAGCRPDPAPHPDLIILQTGRLRGNVYPSEMRGEFPLQHYAYLAGYVKAVRAEAVQQGAEVLLVDLGDSLSGSFAAHVTRGRNMAAFFNTLRYDAIALGNLDADLPADLIAEIRVPVLCPFQRPDGTPAMPGTVPGARFVRGRFAVTLLSNFYGDTLVESDPLRFPSSFGPSRARVLPIRDYEPVLRNLPKLEGVPFDAFAWMKFEPGEKPPGLFLERLRELGIDLILAHRIYSGKEPESLRAARAPDWIPPVAENVLRSNLGFTLARTDLRRERERWRVLRTEVVPLTANTAPPDPAIRAAIEPFGEAIGRADATIGNLSFARSQAEVYRTYVAALSELPDIDLIAYSPESIRTAWSVGVLRASHVYDCLPWTAPLYRVTVPHERLPELLKLRKLDIWERAGRKAGDLHLATSAYYAALLQQQLGLATIEPMDFPSEYEFFLAYLRCVPDLAHAAPGPEWRRAGP